MADFWNRWMQLSNFFSSSKILSPTLWGIFFWNARIIFWSAAMSEANKVCKKASVTYNLFLTEVKWPPPLANFFVCANTAQFIIYTIELVLPSLITYYTKINVTIAITIRIGLRLFLSSLKLILVFQINRSYVITNSSTIQHFFLWTVDGWRWPCCYVLLLALGTYCCEPNQVVLT